MSASDFNKRLATRILNMEIGGNGIDELIYLIENLREFRPEAIFEWGTDRGGSARAFYEIRQTIGFPCRILSVEHTPPPNYASSIGDRVELRIGDGPEICIPEASPDQRTLFFVDGEHDFEAVTREITLVAEACPWAWMIVHDTELPEERRAIDEWPLRDRYSISYIHTHAGMGRLIPK